jgi:hypothetical protein
MQEEQPEGNAIRHQQNLKRNSKSASIFRQGPALKWQREILRFAIKETMKLYFPRYI